MVKADLDFVVENWNVSGFDIWEEVHGIHFYTRLVQYRALIDGISFASSLGDHQGAQVYLEQAMLMI